MKSIRAAAALLLLTSTLAAQYPISWSVTTTTGSPTWTRENAGVASATDMYVFGGRTGNSGGVHTNGLWRFDGATWTQMTANGAVGSPPARDQAAICWDFGRNVLVVFGGNSAGGVLGDTWEWDPMTNTWSQIMGAGPPARRFTAMAWDPTSSSDIILFGGLDSGGVHLNDTWLYFAGGGWTQVTPATTPATRRQHSMMTRQDFGDVVLCCGQDASLPVPTRFRTDLFVWDGSDWTQVITANTPAAVVANQAVYDSGRQRIVVVGGNGISGGSPTSQISEFDAQTNDWTVFGYATPGTSDPVIGRISRYFAAYIPATGYIYKVGGQNPSGAGAFPTVTCQYGIGIPAAYPGNGADASIEVQLNGAVDGGVGGVHSVNPGDAMGFRFFSPTGSLDGEVLLLAAEIFSTGSPFLGTSLLPGDPTNLWLNPANAVIILNGLVASLFQPTLAAGGFNFGPFPVPAVLTGGGNSIMMQLIVNAPGVNAVNLGLSDAVELQLN